MTLGSDVDLLQERYQNTGRMLESYMLEYRRRTSDVRLWHAGGMDTGEYRVSGDGVPFFGDDEAHPLSEMPEILARAKQHKVVCTAGYCLKPKKSVVFEMELAPAGGVRGDGTWRQNLRTLQQEGHMPEP